MKFQRQMFRLPRIIRILIDLVIDFIFGLFWEHKKVIIPNVEKKHYFLTESATSLAKKIKRGELKSEELVLAVVDRIKQVNPYLNAITADRFEEALKEAREIDKLLSLGASDELLRKPFLGVPYTTKECQAAKGMPLTMGQLRRRDEIATEDSEAVKLMRDAGAILIACSNIPELLLWQETRNPVYGMTNNPHHTGRSPGGSSGAEAALVASCASAISSDISGSIRIPAFYCGVFGHYPTPGTTNTKGSFFRNGNEDSMFSLGFISRHVEDLAPLTSIIAGHKANLLRLDRQIDMKQIKFYYIEHASDANLSPLRQEMKDAMRGVIHKISEQFSTNPQPYYHKGLNHICRLWSYWITKEPGFQQKPNKIKLTNKNILIQILKKVMGRSNQSVFSIMRAIETHVVGATRAEWAETLTKSMKEDLFSKLGDNGVLLLPSAPHAAPYHYSPLLRPYNIAYWMLINVLRAPATQIPLGRNKQDLPIGIQVSAAPHNDALCLEVAKYLEKEFGGAVLACKVNN